MPKYASCRHPNEDNSTTDREQHTKAVRATGIVERVQQATQRTYRGQNEMNEGPIFHIEIAAATLADLKAFTDEIQP